MSSPVQAKAVPQTQSKDNVAAAVNPKVRKLVFMTSMLY